MSFVFLDSSRKHNLVRAYLRSMFHIVTMLEDLVSSWLGLERGSLTAVLQS